MACWSCRRKGAKKQQGQIGMRQNVYGMYMECVCVCVLVICRCLTCTSVCKTWFEDRGGNIVVASCFFESLPSFKQFEHFFPFSIDDVSIQKTLLGPSGIWVQLGTSNYISLISNIFMMQHPFQSPASVSFVRKKDDQWWIPSWKAWQSPLEKLFGRQDVKVRYENMEEIYSRYLGVI